MSRPCTTHRTSKTTRGWVHPSSGQRRRRALAKRCGKRAFLMIARDGTLKFPVMKEQGKCCYDCAGIRSAKQRASQYGYASVIRKADALGRKLGCRWAFR